MTSNNQRLDLFSLTSNNCSSLPHLAVNASTFAVNREMTTSFSFSSQDQKSSSIPWSSRSRSRSFWFVSPGRPLSSRALFCGCCCCCCFLQSSSSSRRSGASVRRVWRWCASSVLVRSLDASWSLRSFWSSSSSSSFSIDTQSSSRAVLIFS